MKNNPILFPLLFLLLLAISAAPPAAALECEPRSFGDPLADTPSPEWFELVDGLNALRQQRGVERVRLKVFDTGTYGNEYPEKFRDREELLPQNWSDLAARLEQFRGSRPTDVRMEISNATYNYNEQPFLIIEGGPALSADLTQGRTNPMLYRITAAGSDLSQIVGCY
ncbi:MAG: hypothetical protein SXA11_21595 [Cyanobacteriota bacterium]|nr:hypothetical protein [Cyanobacteriota bacterium]